MRILLLLTIALITTSFAPKGPSVYKNDFIQFTIPKKWKIEVEKVEHWTQINCEKKGATNSGLVIFLVSKNKEDLKGLIDLQRASMKKVYGKMGAKCKLSPTTTEMNGKNKTYRYDYTMSLLGIAHSGSFTALHSCNGTISYNIQGADEDRSKNEAGFKTIIESLSCVE